MTRLAVSVEGRAGRATTVEPFDTSGPLFKDADIAALASRTEDGRFENLLLRGWIDE